MPQRIKKLVNIAGHIARKQKRTSVDGKSFLFLKGRRTLNTASTTKGVSNPSSSLMANTLLWANMILPMPVIASTMYRHYVKGNTKIIYPYVFINTGVI